MKPFFLPTQQGACFCIFHAPSGPCKGGLVYVPPLGEEMNRCRRVAALQAKSLAQAGYAVLQLDLSGTGDSAGDFGQFSWDAWVQDLVAAHNWMLEFLKKSAADTALPQWFWALRGGCLLAASAVRQLTGQNQRTTDLLFWQPVASGSLYLTQWLRLQSASSLVQGKAVTGTQALRQRLLAGEAAEIGGYPISAALAIGLDATDLNGLPSGCRVTCWFASDVAVPAVAPLVPPAFASQLANWQVAGVQAQAFAVSAPAFWQLQEVGDAPSLRSNTLDMFVKAGA